MTDDYDYNDFDIGRPNSDIGRTIDDFSDDDTDTNCTYDQYECKNGICIATQKICDGEKGISYVLVKNWNHMIFLVKKSIYKLS